MGAALKIYKGYMHIFIFFDLAIPLLRIDLIGTLAQVPKIIYIFSRMFTVALDNSGKLKIT